MFDMVALFTKRANENDSLQSQHVAWTQIHC